MSTPPIDLVTLRATLLAAREAYPELRRDIGRTLAAIERHICPPADPPREPLRSEIGIGVVGARAQRRR